jgi:hypothetical protein
MARSCQERLKAFALAIISVLWFRKHSDEAQESGSDSSSTTLEISTLPEPAIVGPLNPNPEFGLIQDPLKWKELKSMDSAEKDRLVFRRANYYLQVWPIPDSHSFYPVLEARRKALQKGI